MQSTMKQLTGLAVLWLLAACTSHSQPVLTQPAAPHALQAAWVVLGEQGQAFARVITTASVCPALIQDDKPYVMQVRALPGTMAQRPLSVDNSVPSSDKPAQFPVLTCEAEIKPGVRAASVSGRALPIPKPLPLKILVLGDTGCRLKAQSNYFQSCNDAEHWKFPQVARTTAQFAPDLVIHVGDYQYRESPCPANLSACADSPWGFGWDTWQADFFTPAAPLLAVAPWVMARGNHESCSRAGQGWWRFLDPRGLQQARDCNLAADDQQGDYSAPYAVPVGGGAQLIVFDSSAAGNKPLANSDAAFALYQNQFRQVDQLAAQAAFSIFIEHHPILGFAPDKSKAGVVQFKPGNGALQSVLQQQHPQNLFAPGVQLLLAGHVHLFEALTFRTGQPMQIVSGNGGSSPDVALPAQLPEQATPFAPAVVDQFSSSSRSGFTTLERTMENSNDWTIKSWDQNGVLMLTCHITKGSKNCS